MTKIGWKMRLGIVLSFIWIALAAVISLDAQRSGDGIGAFIFLGVLPLAIAWGIAWIWIGFRGGR